MQQSPEPNGFINPSLLTHCWQFSPWQINLLGVLLPPWIGSRLLAISISFLLIIRKGVGTRETRGDWDKTQHILSQPLLIQATFFHLPSQGYNSYQTLREQADCK